MGTRHLTIVQSDNQYKIAQYGQWDGYPGGQGVTVHRFLKKVDLDVFKDKLENIRFVTDEDIDRMYKEVGIETDGPWITMGDADKFKQKHPQLSRDMGAEVLEHVYNSTGEVLLKNSISFAGDSLFCEWAWLINLDTGELEVYQGFNKNPLEEGEKFKGVAKKGEDDGYYEISLLHSFKISELPEEKEFVQFLEKLSSEEEEIE